jgi:cell division protein ZapE
MPHHKLNVPENGMLDAFHAALRMRDMVADDAQLAAARRLQKFYTELLTYKVEKTSFLGKLLNRTKPPKGVYFWGGVGRGKSFLMDCFFEAVPFKRKRRVHFHAFMREVHTRLRELKTENDPLIRVADDIAAQTALLCFDEFHVSDIADAMILGRLLQALFDRQVMFCMTSNYPPDGLYPNGLQRHNFLPTIALLKKMLDVLEVDAGIDYRLRRLESVDVYHVPDDETAELHMAKYFVTLAGEEGHDDSIEVLGRNLAVKRRAPGVLWFDFAMLCGGPRSQNDYLELAQEHHTLLLSHVPVMDASRASEARRFTWLVDVLYDQRVKLIITAEAEAHALYLNGPNAQEFPRTVSRLIEMRSREYLSLPHRVDAPAAT